MEHAAVPNDATCRDRCAICFRKFEGSLVGGSIDRNVVETHRITWGERGHNQGSNLEQKYFLMDPTWNIKKYFLFVYFLGFVILIFDAMIYLYL